MLRKGCLPESGPWMYMALFHLLDLVTTTYLFPVRVSQRPNPNRQEAQPSSKCSKRSLRILARDLVK